MLQLRFRGAKLEKPGYAACCTLKILKQTHFSEIMLLTCMKIRAFVILCLDINEVITQIMLIRSNSGENLLK